jgi:NADP-reducing hydrogenase subunit HndA
VHGNGLLCQGSEQDSGRAAAKLGIRVGDCTEDGKFSLEACRCIGACGLAPAIMINDEVYGRLTPQDVQKVLDLYKDK